MPQIGEDFYIDTQDDLTIAILSPPLVLSLSKDERSWFDRLTLSGQVIYSRRWKL